MKYTLIILTLIGGIYYGINYRHEARASSVPAPQGQEAPTTGEILAYIAYVFREEGKGNIQRAIEISFCESGWRPEAINYNSNGTTDHSVFQINSVHTKRYGEQFKTDWKWNIITAKKIFQASGWGPWVCSKKV